MNDKERTKIDTLVKGWGNWAGFSFFPQSFGSQVARNEFLMGFMIFFLTFMKSLDWRTVF